MRVRSIYFKVQAMAPAVQFWSALLQAAPAKEGSHWSEFLVGETRLGLLLNDFGDELKGSSAVPVFEFSDGELAAFLQRAKDLGAAVVVDGLGNPKMNSVVLESPQGHEFELCHCK